MSDEEPSQDDPIQCPLNDQVPSHKDSDLNSLVAEPDTDSPLMLDVLSGPPNTQLHPADTESSTESQSKPADPMHDTDIQVHPKDAAHSAGTQMHSSADREQVVRTRVGRVSKKVYRLIESMVQKPFGFRDIASSVSRKSQSLLTLF